MTDRINAIKARLGSLSPKAMALLPPTAGKKLLTEDIPWLVQELIDAREHSNTFCKCPTHGPSLVQIPAGEFESVIGIDLAKQSDRTVFHTVPTAFGESLADTLPPSDGDHSATRDDPSLLWEEEVMTLEAHLKDLRGKVNICRDRLSLLTGKYDY